MQTKFVEKILGRRKNIVFLLASVIALALYFLFFGNFLFSVPEISAYSGECGLDCTEDPGFITIYKRSPDDCAKKFAFNTDFDGNFSLSDGEWITFNLLPGQYNVAEAAEPGWSTDNIICWGDDDYGSIIDIASGTIDIDLDVWEDIECEFANKAVPAVTEATSSLSGCKFNDLNDNGVWDETALDVLPGWEITLSGAASATTTTGKYGCYEFGNLPPGSYTITEELRPDWVQTYPPSGRHDVVLGEGEAVTGLHFGNYLPGQEPEPEPATGTISVCKLEDADGLASTTADRATSSAVWQFDLNYGSSTVSQQTVGGCTVFSGLEAGIYSLSEVLPSGWEAVEPASGAIMIDLNEGESKDIQFINHKIESKNDSGDENDGENDGSGDTNGGSGGGGGSPVSSVGGGGSLLGLNIANVQAGNADCDSALITWVSSEPATSRVVFDTVTHPDIYTATGTNFGYASSTAEDPDKVTGHDVTVTGLSFGTTYYFRPVSLDSSEVAGDEVTISTLPEEECVKGEEGAPVLMISKSSSKTQVNPGDKNLVFTITVKNTGNLAAFGVKVSDNLPAGMTLSGGGGTSTVITLGDIQPGESKTATLMVDIGANASSGLITNTAEVGAANYPSVSASGNVAVTAEKILPVTGLGFGASALVFFFGLVSLSVAEKLRRKQKTE